MIVNATSAPTTFRRAVRQFRDVDSGEPFLSAPGAVAFVAVEGDDVAGWCWGHHILRPDETSMLYLHELEVVEQFRRRGIGRELVRSFVEAGRSLGATKMFLTAGEASAPARALYEELGGGLAEQGPTVNWFLIAP